MTHSFDSHTGPRLSALIVSFDTGRFALSCARSLRKEWQAFGGSADRLEIIVVDNNSPSSGERVWLETLEDEGVRVLAQPANLGYAGAVQAAFEASQGGDEDYVAVLNADVVFLPGSVREMIRHLESHPQVGAVAPRAFVDEHKLLTQSPVPLPTARREVSDLLARLSRTYARFRARRATARSRRWWQAEIPMRVSMLSGACMFLPRAVAESLGVLMDRRYPLFYEDADLCRRLEQRGLLLEVHPRAQVLHHGARSCGVGGRFQKDVTYRRAIARGAYLERWCASWKRGAIALLEKLVERWPARFRDQPIHSLAHLVPKGDELVVRVPKPGRWRFELSTTPSFASAWSIEAEVAETWTFPATAWEWLFASRYYLRAMDCVSGRVAAAWTFQKSSSARTDAVPVELARHPEIRQDWIDDISKTVKSKFDDKDWKSVS